LQDYLDQLQQIKKMGSIKSILGMIGIGEDKLEQAKIDEKQFARAEAIIQSMTIEERNDPDILNASRRRRIAAGCGTTVQEINKFINQYEQTKKMTKQIMNNKGMMNKMMKQLGGKINPNDFKI
jgi:signal recognition particle subunit SRP54